jgi:hypothetical protein
MKHHISITPAKVNNKEGMVDISFHLHAALDVLVHIIGVGWGGSLRNPLAHGATTSSYI